MSRRLLVVACACALTTIGLAGHAVGAATSAAKAFNVQGSVEQVAVSGATPGATARLLAVDAAIVAKRRVDSSGSVLFRNVAPGTSYAVAIGSQRVSPVSVTAPTDTPPQSLYISQHLADGFGYLKTRDGTLLSIDVRLPGPIDGGPYPTVVEYSGYDESNPDDQQPASRLAQALGYATVGVNMRGTGCSGGAWDYFETLQSLDGYDAIETIAAQPWVLNGKVGMVGISYPGISQLFVAATRPPHLAAITPLSVIDDTSRGTLYPGGILNHGFALGWAQDRADDARPEGQAWAKQRIADGDTTCKANQALRLQAPSVLGEIRALGHYDPTRTDALAPITFVDKIDVPVFLAGTWQDEETGGHFAEMLGRFAPSIPLVVTLTNGTHADSLGPSVATRWAEFLDFYVARRIPSIPPVVRAGADALFGRVYGVEGLRLPPDRFNGYTSYAAALAAYQADPRIRVLFESGGSTPAGAPVPTFELDLPSWPPPSTVATTWYLEPGGALGTDPPVVQNGADSWVYDPAAFRHTDLPSGSNVNRASAAYDWKPAPARKAAAYVSPPLTQDTVMVGTGSVDLWLRSSARDVDLQVTISEVRPDGKETYVQSGWLRASERKLEPSSTTLDPVPTNRRQDAAPLPRGRFTLVRVALFPFGHVFHGGSRIRIVVQPPGGDTPLWEFATTQPKGKVTNQIARSSSLSSRVVLPVLPGVGVPSTLPACGTLRGQPCRPYVAPGGSS